MRRAISAILAGALVLACSKEKIGKDGKPITVGSLRLHTFPSGARVWIDGVLKVDATPATLVLPGGKYHLALEAPGAEKIERDVEIVTGEANELTIDIPKPPDARITVLSDIVGSEVRINGYRRGVTPLAGVVQKPGSLDITITTPTGRAKSVRAELAIGEQKTIEVLFEEIASKPEENQRPILESRPAAKGYLTLGLKPDGRVFTEEGELLGETPIVKKAIDPGEHFLVLRSLDGHYEKRVTVDVEAEQSAVFRFQFRDDDEVPGWKPPPKDAGPRD